MVKENQESYRDLVSVDVGIEDDIGIYGNLMTNVLESQPEPEWEMPSEYNVMTTREWLNK